MNFKLVKRNRIQTALVKSDSVIIVEVQSALDLIASSRNGTGCAGIAISKSAVIEDFFTLSTGLTGEVLQKFVNYNFRLAIIGDFPHYKSEALRDFISESNRGNSIFFVKTEEEAIEKLTAL